MEEIEFSRELVKIMDKPILQKVLKKADTQGFRVQGFDKNVWKAPASMVNVALAKRRRDGKYQCRILLECLAGLEGDSIEINLAREWLKDGEDRGEAEKKLLEEISHKLVEKNTRTGEIKEGTPNYTDEKVDKNVDIVSQQHNRIKKLQKTIQDLRILADEYKKGMENLQKEKAKLEKKYEEEQKKNEKLVENIERLERDNDEYQQQLCQKNENINYYKKIFEKAPRMVCFSKKKIDNDIFPFQNIEQIREWKNEFVDEIEWKRYKEVWIVESDFTYPEVMSIKKAANGRVVCARNLKSLIGKVGGIM